MSCGWLHARGRRHRRLLQHRLCERRLSAVLAHFFGATTAYSACCATGYWGRYSLAWDSAWLQVRVHVRVDLSGRAHRCG